jgi:Na+/H+ antiporter NhaD/arsenite permease-like protein
METSVESEVRPPPRKRTQIYFGHPGAHIPMFEPPDTPSRQLTKSTLACGFALAILAALAGWWLQRVGAGAPVPNVNAAWITPFGLLLVGMAVLPFAARVFWEAYYWAVALGLGVLVAVYYCFGLGAGPVMARSLGDYVSFMFLLGALFVVSGGVLIYIRQTATPAVNTAFLLAGAVLANVLGTTGAAMLLIRPFLRMNKGHLRPYHIIFFIFAVANVGGCLTPIGDPPLFLGYLRGIPFWWFLQNCWPMWALCMGLVLGAFFVRDTLEYRRKWRIAPAAHGMEASVTLYGAGNFPFILLVVLATFLPSPWREILMAVAAFGSLWTTPRRIHVENHFNMVPIKEVALLFAGIFATMMPALNYLNTHAREDGFRSALSTPGHYYYASGALSTVLDSGPAYLAFLESQIGKLDPVIRGRARELVVRRGVLTDRDLNGLDASQRRQLAGAMDVLYVSHDDELRAGRIKPEQVDVALLLADPSSAACLVAVALGTVFFGACTYIGNGPNFMVKTIAEHEGVRCPSFFAYVLWFTLPIMMPALVLVWLVFLRTPA